ncbi:MAG: TlyA family RNA methyltransferase [Acidobacteria bacterium]|nr:TlyA family RNA methyltransferase [Acidobacteriota bacterium]
MAKERLDSLLVERGLAETRVKAQALIMAGLVLAGDRKVDKPGTRVDDTLPLRVLGDGCPFVGRGGLKLAHALDVFALPVDGAVCLDVGSSTGGFTDCLLSRGARQVHCIDVGRNQLHWKLRTDPRVVLREGFNARYLGPGDFPGVVFDRVVMDVSFISQTLILPAIRRLLDAGGRADADVVTLVKPQFEAGPGEVGKGGIVRDEAVRERVLETVADVARHLGFRVLGHTVSPVTGADGNVEYLLHLKGGDP